MGKITTKGQPTATQIVQIAHSIAGKPGQHLMLGTVPEGQDFLGAPFEGRRKKDYERALSYIHDTHGRDPTKAQVFLGGSCNPTTWRRDIAIPMLEAAGVAYFNPQTDDWKPEMMQWEAEAKVQSYVLLFVLDSQTRALATLNEIVEFVLAGRNVIVCSTPLLAGTEIEGQIVTEAEAEDINDARRAVAQMAERRQGSICFRVEDAVSMAIAFVKGLGGDLEIAEKPPRLSA